MCSTPAQRIAEIGKAIDDLASEAQRGAANSGKPAAAAAQAAVGPSGVPGEQVDGVVLRIAKLWEELAELDPEVAKRVATYQA